MPASGVPTGGSAAEPLNGGHDPAAATAARKKGGPSKEPACALRTGSPRGAC
jgi:hypothetical protein